MSSKHIQCWSLITPERSLLLKEIAHYLHMQMAWQGNGSFGLQPQHIWGAWCCIVIFGFASQVHVCKAVKQHLVFLDKNRARKANLIYQLSLASMQVFVAQSAAYCPSWSKEHYYSKGRCQWLRNDGIEHLSGSSCNQTLTNSPWTAMEALLHPILHLCTSETFWWQIAVLSYSN